MTEEFLSGLWRMSGQAGIAVCMILAVRIFFSWTKAPKKYFYMLWAIPFLRMLIPWWLESPFSVFGSVRYMGEQLSGNFTAGDAAIQEPVRGMVEISAEKIFSLQEATAEMLLSPRKLPAAGTNSLWETEYAHTNSPAAILLLIWGAGVLGLLAYCVHSYLKIKKQVKCGICMHANIYVADHLETAFVFGLFSPRIYLPSNMDKEDMRYVVLHEQTHIRRGDYLVKITAFLATVCHWFNPLCWVAFYYMCRDMEMSCDEAVIRRLEASGRQEYAMTLLRMTAVGIERRGIPLAFSLENPEGRIRHIMEYRKSAGFTVVIGAAALTLLAVILLTNPQASSADGEGDGKEIVLPPDVQTVKQYLKDENGADTAVSPEGESEAGSQTIFSYNGKNYDLSQRAQGVNAVTGYIEAGHYIIVKGHIGPHNGYYGIFNTITEEFEKDIFGALLTYDTGAGKGADMDLSDFIYCFWNDIYDGNGNLILSCQMGEMEEIYNLKVENGEIYIDVMDLEAGEVVRTDKISDISY